MRDDEEDELVESSEELDEDSLELDDDSLLEDDRLEDDSELLLDDDSTPGHGHAHGALTILLAISTTHLGVHSGDMPGYIDVQDPRANHQVGTVAEYVSHYREGLREGVAG